MPSQRLPLIQEQMWYLSQLAPDDPVYNVALAVEAAAELDERALSRALNALVARHDCLRMSFHETDAGPAAAVASTTEVELELESNTPRDRAEEERAVCEIVERPFELQRAPLMRVCRLRRAHGSSLLLFVAHHLIWDGSSWAVFADELDRAYRSEDSCAGPGAIDYATYLRRQRAAFEDGGLDADVEYWHSRLRHAPPVSLGDIRHQAGPARRYRYAPLQADALGALVGELAAESAVTPFMVCTAALQTLIARYTGEYDVSVSVPLSRRTEPELEAVLGCLIGFVTIRAKLDPGMSFLDALARVREACHEAYLRADVPTQLDLQRLEIPPAVLSFHNTPEAEFRLGELTLARAGGHAPGGLHELSLNLAIRDGALIGNLGVADSVADAGLSPDQGVGHFLQILRSVVEVGAHVRLGEIRCLGALERKRLLSWGSGPTCRVPEASVVELFEAAVAARGPQVAVVAGDSSATFEELDRRANALARLLIARGVAVGDFVGVCVERGLDAVVALLAIAKAGAAFVPLDPEYPDDRLALMVRESDTRVVVGREGLLAWAPPGVATVRVEDASAADEAGRVGVAVGAADAAFVLFTSGSTGRPKPVVHTHRAIVSRVLGDPHPLSGGERCAQKTSLSFVDSLWEVFAPLLTGGVCVVIDEETVRDAQLLVPALAEQRVNRMMLVPSLLRVLLDLDLDLGKELPELRWWASGGEPLARELVERFRNRVPHAQLINVYGASECWDVTWSDCLTSDKDAPVAIGRPLPGMRAYVLNRQLEPVPPGIAGELCVAGPTVARGYAARRELTAERFVPNPLLTDSAPLYRTGDLARWRHDGTIDYLGRRDAQVKVRGYRVEPGEVETALVAQPDVRQAAVVAELRSDRTRLVAYVVPRHASIPLAIEALRAALAETLPRHMVPAAFVQLEELPLTPHGKLDPSRLPEPTLPGAPRQEAPTTAAEELLTRIWAEALDLTADQISPTDDFFGLGGDSLRAQTATASIRRAIGRDVGIALLFQAPTVRELAAELERLPAAQTGPSPRAAERRPLASEPPA